MLVGRRARRGWLGSRCKVEEGMEYSKLVFSVCKVVSGHHGGWRFEILIAHWVTPVCTREFQVICSFGTLCNRILEEHFITDNYSCYGIGRIVVAIVIKLLAVSTQVKGYKDVLDSERAHK